MATMAAAAAAIPSIMLDNTISNNALQIQTMRNNSIWSNTFEEEGNETLGRNEAAFFYYNESYDDSPGIEKGSDYGNSLTVSRFSRFFPLDNESLFLTPKFFSAVPCIPSSSSSVTTLSKQLSSSPSLSSLAGSADTFILPSNDDGNNTVVEKIACPKPTDILLGRGWRKMTRVGNILLRDVIENRLDDYDDSQRMTQEKTMMIASQIVHELKTQHQVRFLRQKYETTKGGGWIEVADKLVQYKVSKVIFDVRKALKLKQSGPQCKYYLMGTCRWGKQCKYSHDRIPPPPPRIPPPPPQGHVGTWQQQQEHHHHDAIHHFQRFWPGN